ncbi:hypothetical protein B1992_10875 [Pseudoxanthomonas broegbernensis]|uniref:Transmembrane protein n=1 Tax=Pseudoxanthomonas broegbernensis TaxID=83619 RepID=A0A7V8GLA6_9GAMM|nr:hypothetical protein [Pseudoxanthomonas broegbernensis]KAF1685694.1 hypothetical protein B1992_10875 [Pseudoxanthomonas broegbernensis]MBB6066040.1 hypothetical protein [Pseudoxanthomonas broegbernensis]
MEDALPHLLSLIVHQSPWLLACAAGLALLWPRTAHPAPGQTLALSGIGLLLGATLLRLVGTSIHGWLLARAVDEGRPFSDHGMLVSAMQVSFVLLAIASAVGLFLLALGASRAMRAPPRG